MPIGTPAAKIRSRVAKPPTKSSGRKTKTQTRPRRGRFSFFPGGGGGLNEVDPLTLAQWRNLAPLHMPFGTNEIQLQTSNFDDPLYEEMNGNIDTNSTLQAIHRILNKRKESKEALKSVKNKINMEPKLIQNSVPGAKL